MLDNLYLNYYGLAVFAIFFQWVVCSIFLISLSNKSKPAHFLLVIGVISALFCVGYILAHTVYYPTGLPRILCFVVMTFSQVYHTQFVLHFPNLRHPRLAKVLFYIESFVAAILAGYAIYIGFQGAIIKYDFDAHFYEVQIITYLKICGVVGLLITFILYIICIWYAIKSRGAQRKAYILMIIAYIGLSIVPAVLTLMNRSGIITREFFLTYYVASAVLGFFIILVVFLNNTTDRTTFMFKIVSVGFLSFILIFNIIARVVMNEREDTYDLLHKNELNSIIDGEYRPKDLRYIISYNQAEDKYNYIFRTFNDNLDESFKYEAINAFFLENIKESNLTPAGLSEYIRNLKVADRKYFAGYEDSILQYIATLPKEEKTTGHLATDFILSKQSFLFYRFNKIKEIPDTGFRKNLEVFLSKEKEDFSSFKKAIQAHLSVSASEENDLKKEVLFFLLKIKLPTDRKYRQDIEAKDSYVAFHYIDKKTGFMNEVGFSYREYRKFIHSLAIKLFYILLVAMVLILFGTPVFLSGALVDPLNDLLEGLRKVRKGDLTITVPIKVQDEIGYLAGSFNTMVKSIRESKEQLEEYSEHLEQKVEERTNELKSTLDTVNELKTQQDGDYFLTSLLLRPFIVNYGESETVKLEFLISQKKKFEFHGKKYEIGGDLCHTQNLLLNGKNYVLFFNCDSMGKSLQGAGGALVFGSVFFAIVERTNQSIRTKDESPERWLKNAFIELHKVFLTFDGSMLVSSVIGLVDEATGLLYYINAEHPWTVCYRDGICDFIETQNYFSKLGSPINSKRVFVNLYQMKKGDVIFIGSDGRDDFEIKGENPDPNSYRNINYDETEFLRTVTQAEGNLEKIYQITTEKGAITDDYSLIRIQYRGEDFEGREAKSLAIKNYNTKNYGDALKYGLDYIDQNPSDTEFLFIVGHIYKLEKKYDKAAYYAERVRIRNPNHMKNLTNLVQIQIELGDFNRAEEILKECEAVDATSAKLSKLRDLLRLKKAFLADNVKIE